MSSYPSNPMVQTPMRSGSAAIVITGAVALAGIAYVFRHDPRLLLIVLAGGGLVGLLVLAYVAVLRRAGRGVAQRLERAVLTQAAAPPKALAGPASEPARRAALEDLRNKFAAGIAKFRATGKDLYVLPWYLIAGEPGSGKTEAIRRCNVGFPPGLQDYSQGVGGTLNMNWWFTNQAILLDTAGRLLFEEAPPGTTSEWSEFLRLLTRARPHCPINGLMLVIPADSLIKGTPDEIEAKAGKIARQLDTIQRTVGVRFPVFVVVTKCDLINGFREFFDGVTDPTLQHQMLGWSNPEPLDEPFNPEHVDKHMRGVRDRLLKRRQVLLIDPVNTEDPQQPRINQVDALYAFPDSFSKIVPRLRRYLEVIFVAGQWSPEPLFLRGIYFTSSMREGAALDESLAEALQIPVQNLNGDTKFWERDRAFFLRDVFTAKIFREKALVTRAKDTRRLRLVRGLGIGAAAIAAAAALLALTWTGAKHLNQSIGRQSSYWTAVRDDWNAHRDDWAIVKPVAARPGVYRYNGLREMKLGASKVTLGQFFGDAPQRSEDRVEVPWIFRPQVMIRGDLNRQRRQVYRGLYEAAVLRPLVEAVRTKLREGAAEAPSQYAGPAVAQLARLPAIPAAASGAAAGGGLIELDPLFRFLLSDEDYARFRANHLESLQGALVWVYGGGEVGWPPAWLLAEARETEKAIGDGVGAVTDYWSKRVGESGTAGPGVMRLRDAAGRFAAAEDALTRATEAPGDEVRTLDEYKRQREAYLGGMEKLREARGELDEAVKAVQPLTGGGKSLVDGYQAGVDAEATAAMRAYEKLMASLPAADAPGTPASVAAARAAVEAAAHDLGKLREAAFPDSLKQELARLETRDLATEKVGEGLERRRYEIRAALYELGAEELNDAEQAGATTRALDLAAGFKRVEGEYKAGVGRITPAMTVPDARVQEAGRAALLEVNRAVLYRRYKLIDAVLNAAPQTAAAFAQAVAERAAPLPAVAIPAPLFTELKAGAAADARYHPPAACEVLAGVAAIGPYLDGPPNSAARTLEAAALSQHYQGVSQTARQYLRDYAQYWASAVPAMVKARVGRWEDFYVDENKLRAFTADQVNARLAEFCRQVTGALTMVAQAAPVWRQGLGFDEKISEFGGEADEASTPAFRRECDALVERWRALSPGGKPDPAGARRAVLAISPKTLVEQYLFRGRSKTLVERYWYDLSLSLLSTLASDSQAEGKASLDKSLAEVRRFNRFPLAALRKGEEPLTPAELNQASAMVKQLLASVPATSSGTGTQAAPPLTGNKAVDEALGELRGTGLLDRDRDWLRRMDRLLGAIASDKPLSCTVWVRAKEPNGAAGGRPVNWYSVVLQQGGKNAGEQVQVGPLPSISQRLGVVACPGEAIRFAFYKFATNDKERPTAGPEIPGKQWQLLWLTRTPGSRVEKDSGGKRWLVEVGTPDGVGSVPLILDFDRGVPGEGEWLE